MHINTSAAIEASEPANRTEAIEPLTPPVNAGPSAAATDARPNEARPSFSVRLRETYRLWVLSGR